MITCAYLIMVVHCQLEEKINLFLLTTKLVSSFGMITIVIISVIILENYFIIMLIRRTTKLARSFGRQLMSMAMDFSLLQKGEGLRCRKETAFSTF